MIDMAGRCNLFALLTLVIAFSGLLPAQPSARALVERAVELQKQNAVREKSLAFRERVSNMDLDAELQPRRRSDKAHDVLLIAGTPQRILLEEDGKPQSREAIAASQDFLRRVVDIRGRESDKERRERIENYERRQREYREAVSEIPLAFEFALEGEEPIGGRLCYRLSATPRRGYQPGNRYGRLFAHATGTIWIDKATGQWRRADAELRETVNLGWIFVQIQKGTRAIVEQQEYAGQGWLMSSLWYRTVARVGLFMHYRREHRGDYWNYQPMTPSLLAKALEDGYPTGPMQPDGRASQ